MNVPLLLLLCFFYWIMPLCAWQEQLKQKITENNAPVWMKDQINTDLALFTQGITREMIDVAHEYSREIAHFKIINGTVYSETANKVPYLGKGFSPGGSGHKPSIEAKSVTIHNALEDILTCTSLPNVEFLVILPDGTTDKVHCSGPLFAFSKNKKKNNTIILIPDPDVLKNHAQLQEQATHGNNLYPWECKIKQAFWRGGTNDILFNSPTLFKYAARFKLVDFAHHNPALVDALFSDNNSSCQAVKNQLTFSSYMGAHVSIEDHIQYAYQIQIDGFTAAWARMYWQLFSNSVMLKQNSYNMQWYYAAVRPYVHYIPIKSNMSDLAQQINWARNNNDAVQQIITNANTFARDNLTYADILYYIYLLINEYAHLQQFTPV